MSSFPAKASILPPRDDLRTSARYGLDSRIGIAERSSVACSVRSTFKGDRVKRRLVAALMLLASVLGVVQPAFASVACLDCCSTSAPAPCARPTGFAAATDQNQDCCATGAPIAASSAAITAQPRSALDRASGPAALAVLPTAFPYAILGGTSVPPAAMPCSVGQSDTYLRTLRLRL